MVDESSPGNWCPGNHFLVALVDTRCGTQAKQAMEMEAMNEIPMDDWDWIIHGIAFTMLYGIVAWMTWKACRPGGWKL